MTSKERDEYSKAELDALDKSLFDMRRHQVPATKKVIAALIESLANHHPNMPRDDVSMRLYVQDWLDDLAHVPADILEAACVRWRRNTNPFMPKPGQLLKECNELIHWRDFFIDRCDRLLIRHE